MIFLILFLISLFFISFYVDYGDYLKINSSDQKKRGIMSAAIDGEKCAEKC